MKRRKINPIFLVAGIVVIVLGFIIFVPVLLGTASESYNLEKYNQTGPLGNATVIAMSGLTGIFSLLSGAPLTMLGVFLAAAVLALVIIAVLRNK